MNSHEGQNRPDEQDASLPEEVREKIRARVELGYKREHLLVTARGNIILDLEAVEADVFQDRFGDKRKYTGRFF